MKCKRSAPCESSPGSDDGTNVIKKKRIESEANTFKESLAKLHNDYSIKVPSRAQDNAAQIKLDKELEIIELVLEALKDGDSVLAEREPIDSDELGEEHLKAVEARLKAICSGKQVGDILPVQDNSCHHPGCSEEHCYEDGYFGDHCDNCSAWLNECTPIFCLRHSGGKPELTTCEGCCEEEKYLTAGYTDDEGKLQRLRADKEALRQLINQAAAMANAPSAKDFFLQREASSENEVQYKELMNKLATENLMGGDDNFDFLEDHADDIFSEMFANDS